jgi:hypothetical protein
MLIQSEKCIICERNEKQLKSQTPLEWVDTVVAQNFFTMIILFRGTACIGGETYLRNITQANIAQEIRKLGGELYAVCAQKPSVVKQQAKETNFGLFVDSKNLISKKYELGVIQQETLKDKILDKLKLKREESNEQPGFLLLSNEGSIVFQWRQAKITAVFDTVRVNATDMRKIAQFYYSHPDKIQAVSNFAKKNISETYRIIMSDEEARMLFRQHLIVEHSEESLDFIEQVDLLQAEEEKKKELHQTMSAIFELYIQQASLRELNIPSPMRKTAMDSWRDLRSAEKAETTIFRPIYEHVSQTLQSDSFKRFIQTEEFTNVAIKIMPTKFASKIEEISIFENYSNPRVRSNARAVVFYDD